MSRFTKRDRYGHAYTNETVYDRGMTSTDGKTYKKHYFENGTSAYDGKPIDRLCELEDKIEQGDVVEVVRCKDCKYLIEGMMGEKLVFLCKCMGGMVAPAPGLYCSYGKRKEQ